MPILRVTLTGAALLLAACEQPAISASSDSLANRLEVGMTPAQVEGIIGASQFTSRASGESDSRCLSYIYDEAIDAKFVHATFVDGLLVRATDGHRVACELA
ncbi:hypothetical protein AN191_06380 [Loktanella sp. 5RATIMAR09]|uniref:hypothetical protein n=1 Tax=Loktanella sp. 5RATIMAR09 TaxID=1225655 RepID=UPI000707615C|nr:hypothetical protein [Loktanella sp. 5RATIMAR09]KQI72636.1 hypothetical protein AN191_06380 [Loktanella sp. 5RATIMAR09]